MDIHNFIIRVQNKIKWIFNRKIPEYRHMLLNTLLYKWLIHYASQPMNINQKSVIIIAPHQDDEVLGCGGLIASKQEMNIPVQVVFITDGAASHSWHPQFKAREIVPIRREEAIKALSILGVNSSQIHFLDQPDGKLKFLNLVQRQKVIEQLSQLLQAFQPEEIYVTHRHDRSKDHEATYELVQEAIMLSGIKTDVLQYPIWVFWDSLKHGNLQKEDLAGAYRLSIHHVQIKKRQAIETYRSQYLPIDAKMGAILPRSFVQRFFLPYEFFFKSNSVKE